MSTDLFQALTLGLLVIVILALLVAVSMLGKIRAAVEARPSSRDEEEATPGETAATAWSTDSPVAEPDRDETDAFAEDEVPERIAAREPAELAEEVDGGAGAGDSERPFERGGRWYFRRAGELLVYEEGTGEWVPAAGSEDAVVQRQAESVVASGEPAVADEPEEQDRAIVASEPDREPVGSEPSTSFAGQPLASAEEEVTALGAASAESGDTAVSTGFEEPGGGEVDLEEASEATAEPAPQSSESFWKCPSCGAINGSTATSCRMCFTARP